MNLNWEEEAKGVISDVHPLVKDISISLYQPDKDRMILLNIETFEGVKHCIKLCERGFGLVAFQYNSVNLNDPIVWFETPYALLAHISDSYESRFTNVLFKKLENIQQDE